MSNAYFVPQPQQQAQGPGLAPPGIGYGYGYGYPGHQPQAAPSPSGRVKAVGTKLEVWNGVALRTPGNLTRDGLTVKQLPNGGFKVISIAKQKSARERYMLEKAGRGQGLFSLDAKRKGGKTLREHEENKANGVRTSPPRSRPQPQPLPGPPKPLVPAPPRQAPIGHTQPHPHTRPPAHNKPGPARQQTQVRQPVHRPNRTPTKPAHHIKQTLRTYPPALPEQIYSAISR